MGIIKRIPCAGVLYIVISLVGVFLSLNTQAVWEGEPTLDNQFEEHEFLAAIRENNLPAIRFYLDQDGFDPNQEFVAGMQDISAFGLVFAVVNGSEQAVALLLDTPGIDYNKKWQATYLPLFVAMSQWDFKAYMAAMFGSSVDPNREVPDGGASVLFVASMLGKHKVVERLSGLSGLDWDAQWYDGHSPLHVAVQEGHHETVDVLVKSGHFDVNQESGGPGGTPLFMAASRGYGKVVESLLRSSQGNLAVNKPWNGATPLFQAAQEGCLDVVRLLVEAPGIDLNEPWKGMTPLFIAARNVEVEIVRLLAGQPDIRLNPGAGGLALNALAELHDASHEEVVEVWRLLAKVPGLDMNGELDHEDFPHPLFAAARAGDEAMVKLLLDAGVNVNHSWKDNTPLFIAAYRGHLDVVKLLLGCGGIDIHRKSQGATPLFAAVQSGHEGIVELLVNDPGADLSEAWDGVTLLQNAARRGYDKIVELLVRDKKVDPGVSVDERVEPPLFLAVNENRPRVVEVLVNTPGLDLSAVWHGDTAMKLATRLGHKEVLGILSEAEKSASSEVVVEDFSAHPQGALPAGQDQRLTRSKVAQKKRSVVSSLRRGSEEEPVAAIMTQFKRASK